MPGIEFLLIDWRKMVLSCALAGIEKIWSCLTMSVLLEVCELLWSEFGLRFTHCGDGGRNQGALQGGRTQYRESILVNFVRSVICATTRDCTAALGITLPLNTIDKVEGI